MERRFYFIIMICVATCFVRTNLYAQTEQEKVISAIIHLDSLFWNAYNSCDTTKFRDFFTDDVEFYHDKGGITSGANALIESLERNICGNSDRRIRRKAAKASIRVFPLQNSDLVYGAIISGEHLFYVVEKGKNEYLDGQALFTNLWLLRDGVWKMSRILSYNHHSAEYISTRKEIKLDQNKLDHLAGNYKGAQSGAIIIKRENNELVLLAGNATFILCPESENIFFAKDRDLTFEFIRNDKNKVVKLIVREKGNIAEEAIFEK